MAATRRAGTGRRAASPPVVAAGAAVGGRAGLRDPADAAVLDHPVASLRLHDDQRGAAGLRRRRHVRDPAAGASLQRRFAALSAGRAALFGDRRHRRLRARAARAVQSAGDPLGPAPAAVPGRRSTCCSSCPSSAPAPACAWRSRASPACRTGSTASTSWARGAGCLGILGALFVLSPHGRLRLIGALGGVAAAVAWLAGGGAAALAGAAAARRCRLPPAAAGRRGSRRAMSPYKELWQTLAIPGTRIVAERSSPLGLVSVVESPQRAVAPRARAEPQRAGRAAAAARRLHRRRRPERADPLRRPARASPISTRSPRRCPTTCCAAARAGARRRRRRRRAAGALPRRARGRRRGAEPAGRRSGAARAFADFSGGPYARARRARARRRGARLRRRQRATATT